MKKLILLSLVAAFAIPFQATADNIRISDLAPGSKYRIAFVTSGSISATNTDINVYDSLVNGLANGSGSVLAPLGSSWKAIVSTAEEDAYSHIGGAFTIPVFTVDGFLIAYNAADLWDGWLYNSISMNEQGYFYQGGVNVLTGTLTDGSRSAHPLGGDPIYDAITGGLAGAINYSWMVGSFEGKQAVRQIYGISDALTYGQPSTVPLPAALPLLLSGLGVLGFAARRRKETV